MLLTLLGLTVVANVVSLICTVRKKWIQLSVAEVGVAGGMSAGVLLRSVMFFLSNPHHMSKFYVIFFEILVVQRNV